MTSSFEIFHQGSACILPPVQVKTILHGRALIDAIHVLRVSLYRCYSPGRSYNSYFKVAKQLSVNARIDKSVPFGTLALYG